MDNSDFRQWLTSNTIYTKRVISNIVCRLNRADRIHSVYPDEMYLFELEHEDEFAKLSVAVKSQIRKAVKLYLQFKKSE